LIYGEQIDTLQSTVAHSTACIFLCRTTSILLVGGWLVSCDTREKRGLRELAGIGVEPSGFSLVQAAVKKDPRQIGWLLDVGVYTEQRDAKGRTPLRIAVENQDLPSFFKLIEANADVNATAQDPASILGIAVAIDETAMARKLLSAGAKPDGLMPDGEKILPWAIRKGRLTFVRTLLSGRTDPLQKDKSGNPLLHIAMEAGHRDLMESLLALGADAGAKNAAGETTLHLAFRHSWLDLGSRLVSAGADPNSPGAEGFTLLEKAVKYRNTQEIKLLLQIGADPNHISFPGDTTGPFERVFALGDASLLEIFLAHGAKPSDSWLWNCYQRRDLETTRQLLKHGAKASARGANGLFLAETAALDGCGSFVKLLLDYGNPAGHALFRATAKGNAHMVQLLIACGLDPNATIIPYQDSPLAIAIRHRQDRVATALIHEGANIHQLLPEGQSALHLAIATGCPRTVKELLNSGIDPNLPFNLPVSRSFLKSVRPGVLRWSLQMDRNVTPLMMAVDAGIIPTTRYLLAAGAKTEMRTRTAKLWPINFASRRNDVKMMRVLLGKDPQREERQIIIRLSEQRASLLDADGKELFATKISSGRKGFTTPTGEFVITNKHRDWKSTLYHASMPYFQRLSCGDFGLHQGNVPGYPASHGCIRVPEGNAARLFTMTQAGDRVRIFP
jgi:ankyrin repeat protein